MNSTGGGLNSTEEGSLSLTQQLPVPTLVDALDAELDPWKKWLKEKKKEKNAK